jgi:hypothetical protein
MKKIVKEFTVYQFNELSEEAKQKVRENYIDEYRSADCFSSDVIEVLKSEYGLYSLTPQYSLGYNQGDGLCLVGEITPNELKGDMFKAIAFKDLSESDVESIDGLIDKISFTNTTRYSYAKSVDIDEDVDLAKWCELPEYTKRLVDKVVENVKNWYFNEAKIFEKEGYDYFYEISDEELQEWGDDEGVWFSETGQIMEHLNF